MTIFDILILHNQIICEILKQVIKDIEKYNSEEFNNLFHYDAYAELKAIKEYEQEEKRGIKQEKKILLKNGN